MPCSKMFPINKLEMYKQKYAENPNFFLSAILMKEGLLHIFEDLTLSDDVENL